MSIEAFFTENFSYFFEEELVYLKGQEKISLVTIQKLNLSRAGFTSKHILAFTPLPWWHEDTRVYGCFVSPAQHKHCHSPAHRPVNLTFSIYKTTLGKKKKWKTMQKCLLCGIITTCTVIRLQRSLNQMQQHFMKRASMSMYIVYN